MPVPSERRVPAPLSRALSALTWAGTLALLGLAALHVALGDTAMWAVWFHALTPWLYLGVLPFLVLALLRRRPRQATSGACVLVAWGIFSRPPLPSAALPEGTSLRFVSGNALMVNATPDRWVDEVLAFEPDVLVVQEFTPDIQAALAGRFAQSREHPAWHSFGVGLYSRYPIRSEEVVRIGGVDWQRAEIDVDGQGVTVWNVHTLPPFTSHNHRMWLSQVATLTAAAEAHDGPLIVGGDFNLTRHHASYGVLTGPLTDAHRDCGRWVASTWPANGTVLPWLPRIRLDHVFLRGGVRCAAIREGVGAGSDHRPLVVDLVLPR